VLQSAIWFLARSCGSPCGAWTLWHVVQLMLRWSCWLPSQSACVARLWHEVHVSLASAADILL
jgi:hypothetical protein